MHVQGFLTWTCLTTIQMEMGKVTMQRRMEKKVRRAAQQPLSPSASSWGAIQ